MTDQMTENILASETGALLSQRQEASSRCRYEVFEYQSFHSIPSSSQHQARETAFLKNGNIDFAAGGDIYCSNNNNAIEPQVWLGNAKSGDSYPDRLVRPLALNSSRQFTTAVEDTISSLPPNLRNLLKPYQIFTARTADDFLLQLRNNAEQSVVDPDSRSEVRSHPAMTDSELKLQAFIEWQKSPKDSPFGGRYVHFTETHNLKGTVAHEAEHANDAYLGHPSQNDSEFDRLYKEEAGKVLDNIISPNQLGWLAYYIRLNQDSKRLEPEKGKEELFAELGAIVITGEAAAKNVNPQVLVDLFPKTYQYLKGKIQSGEW